MYSSPYFGCRKYVVGKMSTWDAYHNFPTEVNSESCLQKYCYVPMEVSKCIELKENQPHNCSSPNAMGMNLYPLAAPEWLHLMLIGT
jgi:hypothetical protein